MSTVDVIEVLIAVVLIGLFVAFQGWISNKVWNEPTEEDLS